MATYAAMVQHMDADIGRVVDDLRSHHELDNTLVMFLSDNGACAEWAPFGFDMKERVARGDGTNGTGHGRPGVGGQGAPVLHTGAELAAMGQPGSDGISYGSGWANASNTPFRMYKHYDHEGGISTPLIVRWPAAVSDKGGLRRQVGHVIDVMPTLVAVSGATYPAQFNGHAILPPEGKCLLPALADQPIPRDALFWEHEGNRAVRVGDMKLVALDGKPWELYDVAADRAEQHDLSAAKPDVVQSMVARWTGWAARCHVKDHNKGADTVEGGTDAAD